MAKCLVTGCAGFIGSHISERLIKDGHEVIGIDNFSEYYSKESKKSNMKDFIDNKNFSFLEKDIIDANLEDILNGVEYIFHQAAQPGVRRSWGKTFDVYVRNNILATQKLLEVVKDNSIKKLIFASSSSVYGDSEKSILSEIDMPKPISPYGMTKLSAEHLLHVYWKNYSVPYIALRYFTVYGPRQRPDMAFHKFIKAVLKGEKIEIYGDGSQKRDFTYVSDIVDANLLAMKSDADNDVINVGGGSSISVIDTVKIIEEKTGSKVNISFSEVQKGDIKSTASNIEKARKLLGYSPKVSIEEGIEKEVEWIKTLG